MNMEKQELIKKLEGYSQTIDGMFYVNGDSRTYEKAVNITRNVRFLFPDIKRLDCWNDALEQYSMHSAHSRKKDALDEFTRTAKLDLQMIIGSLE